MEPMKKMVYKKPKPKVYVDAEDLPAIKDWKVGETYNIQAKVKLVFQSEGDEYESEYQQEGVPAKKPMKATFKILSIEPIKGSKSKKSSESIPRVKRSH